jgi:hypothetical protein
LRVAALPIATVAGSGDGLEFGRVTWFGTPRGGIIGRVASKWPNPPLSSYAGTVKGVLKENQLNSDINFFLLKWLPLQSAASSVKTV